MKPAYMHIGKSAAKSSPADVSMYTQRETPPCLLCLKQVKIFVHCSPHFQPLFVLCANAECKLAACFTSYQRWEMVGTLCYPGRGWTPRTFEGPTACTHHWLSLLVCITYVKRRLSEQEQCTYNIISQQVTIGLIDLNCKTSRKRAPPPDCSTLHTRGAISVTTSRVANSHCEDLM